MTRAIRTLTILALFVGGASIPSGSLTAQAQSPERGQGRASAPAARRASGLYIVQVADLPVAGYRGGVAGLAATKPGRGRKIDSADPSVARYARYLDDRHDQLLARVGGGRKVYDYRFVFNGFAAELTEAQAEALRFSPGVLSVTRDELVTADTATTPRFLELNERGGLWDQAGGVNSAGDDVIIGVIDSGIWPENPGFSDRMGPKGRRSYRPIRDWKGACVPGEQFSVSNCNQKLIGARRFNAAWGGDQALKAERPWEFASPRDYNGHGSHTAATAAGNHNVKLTGDASVFGRASGVAPRARIAVYKALWSTESGSQAQGFPSDLVAAIDQAVADGVDVINYSISGTSTNFLEGVQVAFLFAADAGVFVSASAGNAGPATSTVAHPSPWITTVAAGTHDRSGIGSVRLGNGLTFKGRSVALAVPMRPLIEASDAALPGADPTRVALCYAAADNDGVPVLDPAKVKGRIVVCDRGVTARVNKSLAVMEAGGAGMILLNVAEGSLDADFHYVPTVHLPHTDHASVHAYASSPRAKAMIRRATIVFDVPAPATAAFSSRGPLLAGGGDILKPDLIAPGQDIVAAVAPPANGGRNFNVYSGTSMSAPHVAGLAALLKDVHPDWSPMMIKSALMTTAEDVIDGPNTHPLVIFRQGAGHVEPNGTGRPGLVFDSDINDWFAFLCGTTTGVNPGTCSALRSAGYSLDPSDMNTPSIAVGDLAGVQTVRRRVTNVGSSTRTYTADITGLAGFNAVVSPSSLTVAPGQTRSFQVTFTRTSAPLNTYTGGQLTLSDDLTRVRVPVVLRPVALGAPAQVSGSGGPISYDVTFGFSGTFAASPRGLIPATETDETVADDPADSFAPDGPGTIRLPFSIGAGTTHARFSLFDANVTPGSDLDLYVFRVNANGSLAFVGGSGSPTSAEEVNLANPPQGSYVVYVHGFEAPGGADFTLFSWLLGSASEGNMTVQAPETAVTGGTGSVQLTFNGLTPATKYLGSVAYSGGGVDPASMPVTIVRVDTP